MWEGPTPVSALIHAAKKNTFRKVSENKILKIVFRQP